MFWSEKYIKVELYWPFSVYYGVKWQGKIAIKSAKWIVIEKGKGLVRPRTSLSCK